MFIATRNDVQHGWSPFGFLFKDKGKCPIRSLHEKQQQKINERAKKIARGVLMNVFINTSAKVKQNKLTKQSKRYDDGFHDSDSDNANTHQTTDTQCDAKISMYFSHTVEKWERETERG